MIIKKIPALFNIFKNPQCSGLFLSEKTGEKLNTHQVFFFCFQFFVFTFSLVSVFSADNAARFYPGGRSSLHL